jgi:hypothetical protein
MHPSILLLSTAALLGAVAPSRKAFDRLWPRRDNPKTAIELQTYATAFAESSDYGELWRTARWYVWLATGDVPSSAVKDDAMAGSKAGEKALLIKPAGVEAQYWTALSFGLYLSAIPPLEAMGSDLNKGFRDPLIAVMKADPGWKNASLDHVGPELALGALYQHLPWPEKDRGKAKTLFEAAVAAHPENLRAHYLLADLIKDDDPKAAREQLAIVINGDKRYDPPDARRTKRQAAALLAKLH